MNVNHAVFWPLATALSILLLWLSGCATTPEGRMKEGLYLSRLSVEGIYAAIVRADEQSKRCLTTYRATDGMTPTQVAEVQANLEACVARYPAIDHEDMQVADEVYDTWRLMQNRSVDVGKAGLLTTDQLATMSQVTADVLITIARKYGVLLEGY